MNGAGSTRRGSGPRTRSGTRREGDDYQDIVAIDQMLRWFGSNELFRWIKLEADDALHLDDITALKADGTRLYRQVKYSTNPTDPDDRWDWDTLLDKKQGAPGRKGRASLLEKWAKSVETLTKRRGKTDAAVATNRSVRGNLAATLSPDGAVDYEKIDPEVMVRLEGQLGGEERARGFFVTFRFELECPGLQELEAACRRRFDRLGGTEQGWASLKEAVGVWVCRRDQPRRGGRICLSDIHRAAGWYFLRSIPQQFEVPDVYIAPPEDFRARLVDEILRGDRGCTVITGAPGSGKSTFASDLFRSLRAAGVPVIRHHYFLPTPGDISLYQRADSRLAAESLMHDLEVDYPAPLGDLAVRNPVPSTDALREWLVVSGRYFEQAGKRLVVILDGLDHVWTERRSSEELASLIGPLLPPPPGLHLLLVTQPVGDDRLPHKLLSSAPREGWFELPRLDEGATESWLVKFLKGTLASGKQPRWRFPEQRAEFAAALQRHSKGHPLHLRYTVQAIVDRQLPLTAYSLECMPEYRPEGIAGYYRSLWGTLGRAGQDALHLVTACGFALPPEGIVHSLENAGFSRGEAEAAVPDVGHLLEAGGGGMRPFHASLVVHVREQPDHGSRRKPLLRSALRWLKESAPDEFRWAHAWALEADLGEPRQLIDGLTRRWLVDAVADLRPAHVIKALISRGLWHAAARGELDALVRIALLCDYSIAAFEYRDDLVSSLVPPLLVADDTGVLPSRLAQELESLHHLSLRPLAQDAARRGDRTLAKRVFEELRNRATSRHPGGRIDSQDVHESAIAVASLSGGPGVQRVLRIASGNRARGSAYRVLAIAARELRLVGDGKSLRELLQRLTEADYHPDETRAAVREAVLHSLETGWLPPAQSLSGSEPAIRIHAALKGKPGEGRVVSLPRLPDPSGRLPDYRAWRENQEESFRDTFLAMLAEHLQSPTDAMRAWIARTPEGNWLGGFLPHLDDVASRIAAALRGNGPLTFRRLYKELERYPVPAFRGNQNIDECRLSACAARAALDLGFDIVAIARGVGVSIPITAEDIESLRHSSYCIFPEWLALYGEFGRPLLAPGAWQALLEKEEAELAAKIGPLPEKASRYSLLARIAAVEGEIGDAHRLVRAAAECLVAHGDHKDMLLTDVLRSVQAIRESLDPADRESVARLREWVIRLAPTLAFASGYTDGDETGHLPGELAEVLGRIAPNSSPRTTAGSPGGRNSPTPSRRSKSTSGSRISGARSLGRSRGRPWKAAHRMSSRSGRGRETTRRHSCSTGYEGCMGRSRRASRQATRVPMP